MSEHDYDVVIAGYGPAGQTLATLLGRAGHRVGVFERFGSLYDLPRAVHFDHEIMRIWQRLGIVDEIADDLLPFGSYTWFGADGEEMLTIEPATPSASGWESDYLFFQPTLEAALDRAAQSVPTVEIQRGWSAEQMSETDEGIELVLRRVREPAPGRIEATDETKTVRARYLIGADGANSFVREAAGIGWEDLGFDERVLTLDVRPNDMSALDHLPVCCQWCDPQRPHMHTRNGRSHRRWEFMLMPGESNEEFDAQRVWDLLSPFIKPDEGELIRYAVYQFRSLLAERMNSGRVLLAGDAAHLMPPFMGQGLCSGIRDALNVAWKLDLILRDVAGDELLDSYTAERRPQNEWIVRLSLEMGRVSCEIDPQAAAERDATMRAAETPPPVELPPLEQAGSVLDMQPPAGVLGVQGRVAAAGAEGLFDDVVGQGFSLITAEGDPRAGLDAEQLELLDRIGTVFASLDPDAPGGVRDLDGRLREWMRTNSVAAVLTRPDFYVFGAVAENAALPGLIDSLRDSLSIPAPITKGSQ
jgi:2-polyprenyl-6-methoxyphenol hydroxylase-like FAD-dependent oxidoreductase